MNTTVNPLLQARIETVMRDHAAKRDRAFGGRDVFLVDDAVIDREEATRRGLIPADIPAPPYGGGLTYGIRHREFDKDELIGALIGFGALALIAVALGWAFVRGTRGW